VLKKVFAEVWFGWWKRDSEQAIKDLKRFAE
jgi:hypothetical protein